MNTVTKLDKHSGVEYSVITDKDGITEINLKDFFKKTWWELPWLEETYNCIYLVTNLINNKKYVGQTTYLWRRFGARSGYSHLGELWNKLDTTFCRAIRKYTSKNFKVEILESNLPEDSLDEREIYWIQHFHTCCYDEECWGYNMTWGGHGNDHMMSEEYQELARINSSKSKLLSYHRILLDISDDPLKIIYEVGFPNFYRHLRRVTDRIDDLRKDPRWNSKFEESYQRFLNTNYDTTLSKLFSSIYANIQSLRNQGLEITPENYLRYSTESKYDLIRHHYPNLINSLDLLRKDIRWTPELDKLVTGLIDLNPRNDSSTLSRTLNAFLAQLDWLKECGFEINPYNYCYKVYQGWNQHILQMFWKSEELLNSMRWKSEYSKLLADTYDYCLEQWPDWTLENLGEVNPYK